MNLSDLLMIIFSLLLGIGIGFIIRQLLYANKAAMEKEEAGNILNNANEEARNIQLQAKDKALEIRHRLDHGAGAHCGRELQASHRSNSFFPATGSCC